MNIHEFVIEQLSLIYDKTFCFYHYPGWNNEVKGLIILKKMDLQVQDKPILVMLDTNVVKKMSVFELYNFVINLSLCHFDVHNKVPDCIFKYRGPLLKDLISKVRSFMFTSSS